MSVSLIDPLFLRAGKFFWRKYADVDVPARNTAADEQDRVDVPASRKSQQKVLDVGFADLVCLPAADDCASIRAENNDFDLAGSGSEKSLKKFLWRKEGKRYFAAIPLACVSLLMQALIPVLIYTAMLTLDTEKGLLLYSPIVRVDSTSGDEVFPLWERARGEPERFDYDYLHALAREIERRNAKKLKDVDASQRLLLPVGTAAPAWPKSLQKPPVISYDALGILRVWVDFAKLSADLRETIAIDSSMLSDDSGQRRVAMADRHFLAALKALETQRVISFRDGARHADDSLDFFRPGTWRGTRTAVAIYVVLVFLCGLALVLCENLQCFLMARLGLRLRATVVDLVFARLLSKKTSEDANAVAAPSGGRSKEPDVVDGEALMTLRARTEYLVGVDAGKFVEVATYVQYLWMTPVLLLLVCLMQCRVLGWQCALVQLSGYALYVASDQVLKSFSARANDKRRVFTMERLRLCGEFVSGIKVLKMLGWEQAHVKRIAEARAEELRYTKVENALYALTAVWVSFVIPDILIPVTLNVLYGYLNGGMSLPTVVFAIVSSACLIFPLLRQMHMVTQLSQLAVSLRRVEAFLQEGSDDEDDGKKGEPKSPNPKKSNSTCSDVVAAIRGAEVGWSDRGGSSAVLRDVSIEIKRGAVVLVTGRAGTGKSTLLLGLLGEASVKSKSENALLVGNRNKQLSVVYVSQRPWLRSGVTLRDNILFFRVFDEKQYRRVLAQACLLEDLEMLQDGDQFVIGEGGAGLSGGQRARVALARALYDLEHVDVLVIDDVLAALDARTGARVSTNLLSALRADQTLVFATNKPLAYAGGSFEVDRVAAYRIGDGVLNRIARTERLSLLRQVETAGLLDSSESGDGGGLVCVSPASDRVNKMKYEGDSSSEDFTDDSCSDHDEGALLSSTSQRGGNKTKKLVPVDVKRKTKGNHDKSKSLISPAQKQLLDAQLQDDVGRSSLLGVYGLYFGAAAWLFLGILFLWVLDQVFYVWYDGDNGDAPGNIADLESGDKVGNVSAWKGWLWGLEVEWLGYAGKGGGDGKNDRMTRGDATALVSRNLVILASFSVLACAVYRSSFVPASRAVSKKLFDSMLKSLARAAPAWYDATAPGKIISRLSGDQEVLDVVMVQRLQYHAANMGWLVRSLWLLGYASATACFRHFASGDDKDKITAQSADKLFKPLFILLLLIAYFVLWRTAAPVVLHLQRLASVAQNPVATTVGEVASAEGLASVRAAGMQGSYRRLVGELVDAASTVKTHYHFTPLFCEVRISILINEKDCFCFSYCFDVI